MTIGRTLRLLALLGLVAACSPIVRNHGFIPFQQDLDRIVIGQDTRASVEQLAGPPTAGGVLSEGDFYYVSSQFRTFGLLPPREMNRQVLAIRFGPDGTVRNIERYGQEDGRIVTLSRRVTDDNIADVSFIRQLLGNVGRVSAADLLGEPG